MKFLSPPLPVFFFFFFFFTLVFFVAFFFTASFLFLTALPPSRGDERLRLFPLVLAEAMRSRRPAPSISFLTFFFKACFQFAASPLFTSSKAPLNTREAPGSIFLFSRGRAYRDNHRKAVPRMLPPRCRRT